jgi:hypothetical protein
MAVQSFGKGYYLAPGDTLDNVSVGHVSTGGAFRARINQFTVIANSTGGTPLITAGASDPKVFTVTIATPGVVTSVAHGRQIGTTVRFTTTGALPTGLTVGTTYFIIAAGFTADVFQLATTLTGTAINTSGTQSGVHTMIGSVPIWSKAVAASVSETVSAWGSYQELDNIHLATSSTNTWLIVYLSL